MATKVYFINSPDAEYTDEEFGWFQSLMLAEGVIGNASGVIGLQVIENGTPDMSVLVGTGKALVEVTISGRTFKVVFENTAQVQKTIAANALGTNRVDAVIVRIDKDTAPNSLKNNVGTIEVITGTGASALSNAAIDTAVGDDGWYRLANVTVANGDTSVITAEIADTRVRVAATPAFDFANAVPVGSIQGYGGGTAPTGYLLCQGQAISRSTYANLFSVLGIDYGVGDGSTTFNLPNGKGRALFGEETANKHVLEDCEDAWNESTAANVTSSLDTGDKKVGSGSAKLVVGSAVAAGTILATEAVSSNDLRPYTMLYAWIKSSVAAANGDLQLLLDNTASCGSPVESINIPALVANTWTRVQLPLAAHQNDGAIISIGLKMVTDLGAFDLWIDDVCYGEAFERGLMGGELKHVLTVDELAAHTHNAYYQSDNDGGFESSSGNPDDLGATSSTGGDQPHNVTNPHFTANWIIKY